MCGSIRWLEVTEGDCGDAARSDVSSAEQRREERSATSLDVREPEAGRDGCSFLIHLAPMRIQKPSDACARGQTVGGVRWVVALNV